MCYANIFNERSLNETPEDGINVGTSGCSHSCSCDACCAPFYGGYFSVDQINRFTCLKISFLLLLENPVVATNVLARPNIFGRV